MKSMMAYSSDRHLYKGYDKRKYYDKRDYGRPYEIDDYGNYERSARKGYMVDEMYENSSNFSARSKGPKDYFYEREKHSFDRDSTESFESGGRRRKSFGSGGDMCGGGGGGGGGGGSVNYRGDRYSSADRKRSLRKANKQQRSNDDEYEPDSDGDANMHRLPPTETRSLQRRPRKSSGSSPWDGDGENVDHQMFSIFNSNIYIKSFIVFGLDMTPTGQRSWKRPASASESERKLAENRRLNAAITGSDGEKDRRYCFLFFFFVFCHSSNKYFNVYVNLKFVDFSESRAAVIVSQICVLMQRCVIQARHVVMNTNMMMVAVVPVNTMKLKKNNSMICGEKIVPNIVVALNHTNHSGKSKTGKKTNILNFETN